MKRLRRLVLTVSLLLAPTALRAQAPPPVPTVSRLVLVFSGLESEWMEAARRADAAALDRLMTEDFEARGAATPGAPTPRGEWLAAARGIPEAHLSQMAVRALGDVAVVSFRTSTAAGRTAFCVDVWVQNGGGWRVAARYESAAS